ncbi:MAG: Mce-associated rane protein [Pseudonocardiales bacterium]|jgi:Mce-associated membrane protein|nr:Mce-associated rane protein [Pseudonocardiales bacterium]
MTETETRERSVDAVAPPSGRTARKRKQRRRPGGLSRRLPSWIRSVRLPGRRIHLVLGGAAVLLVAALVWLVIQTRTEAEQRDDETAALAVARQTVVNLLTIDPATAKAALQRLEDASTGEFKQQVVAEGDQFGTVVDQAEVNATGTISEAGVRTLSGDQATVLVSAVGLVKNTETPQGEPRQYRMVLGLQRDAASGNWFVAKLDFVP